MLHQPGPFAERPARILFHDWLQAAALLRDKEAQHKASGGGKFITTTEQQPAAPAVPVLAAAPPPPSLVRQSSTGVNPVPLSPHEQEEDYEVLPLELFQPDDRAQMDTLMRVLFKVPEVVLYFLTQHVFTKVMRHQTTKLQASGVDLGSDILFGLRLGFSGTPSDLLPTQLRPCHYEPGSEAEIIRVLTNPRFVSHETLSNWSVHSLLRHVAQRKFPNRFHALIDTGALITGMNNEEVARYLLAHGLEGLDACVFLDGNDCQMVVDRSGGHAVPLNRCGVSVEKRFTFYDQVHSVGMDIKQALDACAAVTLGKDMTLRDFAQGCYRMRGLGKGQTLHVLIVDEVQQLIRRVNASAHSSGVGEAQALASIIAWLLSNSMRTEKLQHLALCQQQLHNVWRRTAFSHLLKSAAPSESKDVLLSTRFRAPIRDEAERVRVLETHSVLSDKDRARLAQEAENKKADARLKQILAAIEKANKKLPVPLGDIMRQCKTLARTVGAVADLAKQMGVVVVYDTFDYSRPWNCVHCTFANAGGSMGCAVCNVKRDVEHEKRVIEEATRKAAAEKQKYTVLVEVFEEGNSKAKSSHKVEVESSALSIKDFRALVRKAAGLAAEAPARLYVSNAVTKQTVEVIDAPASPADSKAPAPAAFKLADYPSLTPNAGYLASCELRLPAAAVAAAPTGPVVSSLADEPLEEDEPFDVNWNDEEQMAYALRASQMADRNQAREQARAARAAAAAAPPTAAAAAPAAAAPAKPEPIRLPDPAPAAAAPSKPVTPTAAKAAPAPAPKSIPHSGPTWLSMCIELFREELTLDVEKVVPHPEPFSTKLAAVIASRHYFLDDDREAFAQAHAVLTEVSTEEQLLTKGHEASSGSSSPRPAAPTEEGLQFDSEMVQEQEQEEEKEKEVEQEQQVIVDYAQNPNNALTWKLADLTTASSMIPSVFYPLSSFHATKRTPALPYPASLLLSENYAPYLHRSDLARRLKNVTAVMHWTPKYPVGSKLPDTMTVTGADGKISVVKRPALPAPNEDNSWMAEAYRETMGLAEKKAAAQGDGAAGATKPEDSKSVTIALPPRAPPSTYSVAVSLAEAEALRRALHTHATSSPSPFIVDTTCVQLCTAAGLFLHTYDENAATAARTEVLIHSLEHRASEDSKSPAPEVATATDLEADRQTLRFFDNQMWFNEHAIILVLRALAHSPESLRRTVFEQIVGCRRRDRTNWVGTNVAQVFSHADEKHLLRLRDLSERVRAAIAAQHVNLLAAFRVFDQNKYVSFSCQLVCWL
jgi:hypothetical protein